MGAVEVDLWRVRGGGVGGGGGWGGGVREKGDKGGMGLVGIV